MNMKLDSIVFIVLGFIYCVSATSSVCLIERVIPAPYQITETEDGGGDTEATILQNNNTSSDVECLLEGTHIEDHTVSSICNRILVNGSATLPVFVLTLRSQLLSTDKSYYSVCRNGPSGIMTWIPATSFADIPTNEFANIFEGYSFIARYQKENSTKSDICVYDVTAHRCLSLSTRDIVKDGVSFELLLEKLPIRYELHETTYSSWRNVTEFDTKVIGEVTLSNLKTFTNFQQFNVSYAYMPDIFIQFPLNLVPHSNVDIYKGGDELLDTVSVGISKSRSVEGQLTSVKSIPALQAVQAFATGQIVKEVRSIEGSLYKIYEENEKYPDTNTPSVILKTNVIVTTINNLHVTFGNYFDVENVPTTTKPKDEDTGKDDAVSDDGSEITTTDSTPGNSEPAPNPRESNKPDGVYPAFKTIFVIACIIFFSVALIAAADVTRRSIAMRRQKRQRRNSRTTFQLNTKGHH